jgi:hypothetical protein
LGRDCQLTNSFIHSLNKIELLLLLLILIVSCYMGGRGFEAAEGGRGFDEGGAKGL